MGTAAIDKTETHEVQRGDGKLVLEITYTPQTGLPVRLHRLKMRVTEAIDCSPNIFVYQRATEGAPMEDGSPRDEFVCIADELDEDEIPVDEPDMARGIPYYRVRDLELLFRNSDLMYETVHSLLMSIQSP